MNALPQAVLWDFDGTLVNTEPLWQEVERGYTRELGGELPENFHEQIIGGHIDDTARVILQYSPQTRPIKSISDELWHRMKHHLSAGDIPYLPGVESLVAAVAGAGVPQGLVSSGYSHYVQVVLDRLDPNPFATRVCGDEVRHPKPHPEPYLTACEHLGVDPAQVLVFEDSRTGVASAQAAGCVVVAIPAHVSIEDAARRVIVPTLEGVGLDGLGALFAEGIRRG